jgi:hypothetical protein
MKIIICMLLPLFVFAQDITLPDTLVMKNEKIYNCSIIEINDVGVRMNFGKSNSTGAAINVIDKIYLSGKGIIYRADSGYTEDIDLLQNFITNRNRSKIHMNKYPQDPTRSPLEYELSLKLKSSLQMKNTGQGLTGLGINLNVVGFFLIANGEKENIIDINENNSPHTGPSNLSSDAGSEKILIGTIGIVAGTVMTVTGVTLWIVGGAKSNRYERLMNESKTKVSMNINQKGIGLHLYF